MVAVFWCPGAGFLQRSEEWNIVPWVQHHLLVPPVGLGGGVGGVITALTANWFVDAWTTLAVMCAMAGRQALWMSSSDWSWRDI